MHIIVDILGILTTLITYVIGTSITHYRLSNPIGLNNYTDLDRRKYTIIRRHTHYQYEFWRYLSWVLIYKCIRSFIFKVYIGAFEPTLLYIIIYSIAILDSIYLLIVMNEYNKSLVTTRICLLIKPTLGYFMTNDYNPFRNHRIKILIPRLILPLCWYLLEALF
jgi:hypothetical protein